MNIDQWIHGSIARLNQKIIFVIFCLFVLPSVFAPFHADDYFHLLLLSENGYLVRGGDGSLWGLFSFIDAVPEHRLQMQQYGVLPWFAADDFHFRFWRPLSELTHWVDYHLFGIKPVPAHIQSILWFMLVCGIFYKLAIKTFPENKILPLIALAIFAWDGQHVATIGWIANRNALIAAVFSLLTLYTHILWRESGFFRYQWAALVMFILALFSGEASLAIISYLFFYAFLLDRNGFKRGLISIVPYFFIAGIWFYFYKRLDFGVHTSAGLYLDPLNEPLEYIKAICFRIPVYFTAGILPLPAGLSWGGGMQYTWISPLIYIFSLMVILVFIRQFGGIVSRNKVISYWLLSSLGALLPVCVTLAQDRLALFQTVGMDMVIAALIYHCLQGADKDSTGKYKNIVRVLMFIHLLVSPLHLLAGSIYIHAGAENIKRHALGFDDKTLEENNLVIFQAPIGEAVSLMGIRKVMGKPLPDHFFWLSNDEGHLTVRRSGEYELIIEKPTGFASGFESAFRSARLKPFKVGQIIPVGFGEIEILNINQQLYPDTIRLHFIKSLDKPVLLYTYQSGEYIKIEWPGANELLNL